MAGLTNSPGIRKFGYLQHKGKKKLMSFWRKYYCVLSGRILLFYSSESAYESLDNYLRALDLGLAYAVEPALGIENAIQVSTHLGPQWLKARDEENFFSWLNALQRACVSNSNSNRTPNEIETLNTEMRLDRIQFRQTKSLSVTVARTDASFEIANSQSAQLSGNASSFKRISLNIFPGHGRQYPTYDGMRKLNTAGSSSEVTQQSNAHDPDLETEHRTKLLINNAMKRVRKGKKNPRPLSESVSDFLLLNSPTKKEAPVSLTASPSLVKKTALQNPRIPKNDKVDKLLLNVEPTSIELDGNDRNSYKEDRPNKSMTNLLLVVDKPEPLARSKSDSKVTDSDGTSFSQTSVVGPGYIEDSNKALLPNKDSTTDYESNNGCPEGNSKAINSQEAKTYLKNNAVADSDEMARSTPVDDGKASKKVRRKSSLAKLKHLLFPLKSKRKEGHQEISKDKLDLENSNLEQITQEHLSVRQQQDSKFDNQLKVSEEGAEKRPESKRKSWHSYQQQISEGNESIVEEVAAPIRTFECSGMESATKEMETTDVDSQFELPVQRRKLSAGDLLTDSSTAEARQRKHSMQVHPTCSKESRSRKLSTRSFEFENSSRQSRTLDRRSTVRALDFNFDLALDVGVVDRLPLPPKIGHREQSPGNYDLPNALCRHCSLPISFLLRGTSVEESELNGTKIVPVISISCEEADSDLSNRSFNSLMDSNESNCPAVNKMKPIMGTNLGKLVEFFNGKQTQLSVTAASQNEDPNNRFSYAVAEEEVVMEETLDQLILPTTLGDN